MGNSKKKQVALTLTNNHCSVNIQSYSIAFDHNPDLCKHYKETEITCILQRDTKTLSKY